MNKVGDLDNVTLTRVRILEINLDMLRFRLQMAYARRKPIRKQIREIQKELLRLKNCQ